MRTGASNKQTDFRGAPAPASGKAPHRLQPPRPSDAAHLFTKDDVVEHIASNFDGDDLAAFEAISMRMRG